MKRLVFLILCSGLAIPAQAQDFTTRQLRVLDLMLSPSGNFIPPRYATAALPVCGGGNPSLAYDSTLNVLKLCNGTAYATVPTAAAANLFTGLVTFGSAVDAAGSVRLGETASCLVFEGSGADASETSFCASNPGADLTFNMPALSVGTYTIATLESTTQAFTTITDSALTATRMTFAGTAGLLSDDADCTFSVDTLTCTKFGIGTSADLFLSRTAAGSLQLGADVNGAPVPQIVKAHNGITGSNIAGASLTLEGGIGTGTGVGGSVIVNRPIVKASGTTVQTYAPSLVVCPSKTLSNTSAQAQTIATITTTTTTGGTVTMDYGNVACSGSTCDTDSGIVKVSWNNNAGTVAAAMTAVVGQSDSDATGTLAATPTATVATNVVSIKLTPTWVTIVPTTVTSYATFTVHSSGDTIACQ